jgi:nicotinamide-nucleotide amidase
MTYSLLSLNDIGQLLKAKKLYLATAESCTGGLLGHLITNIPGSSDYFLGGFLTYSNQAKELFLEVQAETLGKNGAVSRETVLEMARGARFAFKGCYSPETIIGLSTSGIAGPGGGSPAKPVGTVWVGLSGAGQEKAELFHFEGTREEIKYQTVLRAFEMLGSYL